MCEVVTNIHNVLFSLLEKPENVLKVQQMYVITLWPLCTMHPPLLEPPYLRDCLRSIFIINIKYVPKPL